MKLLKKGILGAALLALVSVMPLWAIWEGNAGIASSVEFPGSGNFAKSDMFPKNTIVEILNLETNIQIRAVITGASGVPGLVAMLSPDAAAALNVKSGSVSRVRISVPSPVSETPAAGTLSGGTGSRTADPDTNPESASIEADKLAGSAIVVDAAAGSAAATGAAAAAPETLAAIASPSADPLVPVGEEVPAVEEPETAVAVEPIETEAPPVDESSAVAEVPAVPETLEPFEAVELADTAMELPEAPEPDAPAAETPGIAEAPEAPAAVVSSTMYDEPELLVTETAAPEIVPETTPETTVSETVADLEPAVPVEPEIPVEELTETIVSLEPAEMLPPPAPEVAAVPELHQMSELEPGIELEPVAVPEIATAPVAAAIAVEPVLNAPSAESAPTAGELPLINSFEKGKYYVQIASYAETSNIYAVMKTWGGKYPIAVERSSSNGKEIYKVYVGPVTRDEYGAVLERFKAAGYRDSFVKKGS